MLDGFASRSGFWRCACRAVILCSGLPASCPRSGLSGDRNPHGLVPLARPERFDFLVASGACRKCGGPFVLTSDEVTDALPHGRCASCGWAWFVRPGDLDGIRGLARTKDKKGGT